ncbi:MAG: inactive transglutaminase family protein, partial [Methylococcales bacterium]|nr:inactive transglutaminase family protein [Methylococcales bacterium]
MKNNQRHLYTLIAGLFCLGLLTFCYRHWVLDVPLTATENVNSWVVEANLRFTAEPDQPIKAQFNIPYLPPNIAILDEYFVSHQYGVTTHLEGLNRQTQWSIRRAQGLQSLYYRAILREAETDPLPLPKRSGVKKPPLSDTQRAAVESIISGARETSADIQTFTQCVIKALNTSSGSAKVLLDGVDDDEHLLRAILLVLNQDKIRAIAVRAVQLSEQRHAGFKWYVAVFTGKAWMYLDPHTGNVGLPQDILVWQYGQDPVFDVEGGRHASFNLTLSPTPVNALSIAKLRGLQTDSELLRFSLLQLPVGVQEMYKILLTVPIGAFIILLLRNFVGLKTFGTFMPVLIALAFRETHVIWGLSLFIIIVAAGLLVRFYLAQLRLLLVPRLSAILITVILLMVLISIVSQNLGLDRGLSVALFPMVILTMTIERMCIVWDERGGADAMKSGAGSLLAALIAYSAMNNAKLQYL